jgi:hypothetical protein
MQNIGSRKRVWFGGSNGLINCLLFSNPLYTTSIYTENHPHGTSIINATTTLFSNPNTPNIGTSLYNCTLPGTRLASLEVWRFSVKTLMMVLYGLRIQATLLGPSSMCPRKKKNELSWEEPHSRFSLGFPIKFSLEISVRVVTHILNLFLSLKFD